MVYARKARQIGVADSFQAGYKSATSQSARDLYVATKYLGPSDRVLVMDAGRLAEFGPPRELLAAGGLYAALARAAGVAEEPPAAAAQETYSC